MPRQRQVCDGSRTRPGAGSNRSGGIHYGCAESMVWDEVLRRACADGDLRREGVRNALRPLTSVSADDVVTALDHSSPGAPPTRGVDIARVDPSVRGGLQGVAQHFTAPDATSCRAPRQS